MKSSALVFLAASLLLQQAEPIAQSPLAVRAQPDGRNSHLIAHIEHDGLIFSVALDVTDEKYLKIVIPEKDQSFAASQRPIVRLRVVMRDDTIIDGRAEPTNTWISMGGWVDVTYRFALGKPVVVDDIHSVTIWIADQSYTLFPF
jgi:hypothetical protein